MSDASPIPAGYQAVTPYLVVRDAAAALDFYKEAFGAAEVMRLAHPSGKLMHAEIRIGGSAVMLADEWPEMGTASPATLGGSPVSLYLYVEDADAVAAKAVAGGASLLRPVQDQFYGDRAGAVVDPFGHVWHVATRQEEVPPDELQRRTEAMCKG